MNARLPNETSLSTVPVEVRVCVGVARPLIRDLMALDADTTLLLDKTVNDPVEIMIGDKVIAYGHLESPADSGDGKISVRITQAMSPETSEVGNA